jgi:hypothetical protein
MSRPHASIAHPQDWRTNSDLEHAMSADALPQKELLLHVEAHIGTRILARVIMARTAMAA